jgi:hypothetical protein
MSFWPPSARFRPAICYESWTDYLYWDAQLEA